MRSIQILTWRNSMANELNFVSADHFDRDLYRWSQTRERVLNAAIVQADISEVSRSILRSSTHFTTMILR